METDQHAVWEVNTTGSPLNTGLRDTPRPLITVYDTVNHPLTCSNFGFFPLDFLRIHLNTSLNTLAQDHPTLFRTSMRMDRRSTHLYPAPLYTVHHSVRHRDARSHLLKLRIFPLRLFQQLRDRFWLKTNSILINPHLLLVHQPSPLPSKTIVKNP